MEDVEWQPWMRNRRKEKYEAMEDHGYGPKERRADRMEAMILCAGTLAVLAAMIAGVGILERDRIYVESLTSVEATMQANGIVK